MTPGPCPHGFAGAGGCEICRVLGAEPATPARRFSPPSSLGRRGAAVQLRLGGAAIVALVGLFLVVQALAVVSAVLRLVQFVAVAALAGWIGWRLGVAHGRRSRQ